MFVAPVFQERRKVATQVLSHGMDCLHRCTLQAINIVGRFPDPLKAAAELVSHAKGVWMKRDTSYRDDITTAGLLSMCRLVPRFRRRIEGECFFWTQYQCGPLCAVQAFALKGSQRTQRRMLAMVQKGLNSPDQIMKRGAQSLAPVFCLVVCLPCCLVANLSPVNR